MPVASVNSIRKERSSARRVAQHFRSCGMYDAVAQKAATRPMTVTSISSTRPRGGVWFLIAGQSRDGGAQYCHGFVDRHFVRTSAKKCPFVSKLAKVTRLNCFRH